MNWDDVRIFLAVARAGQILGAARRLGLNHATVSRRVAALEESLNARLFRRLTTGSELTPAGEHLLGLAERMEEDMIAAIARISDELGVPLGQRSLRDVESRCFVDQDKGIGPVVRASAHQGYSRTR